MNALVNEFVASDDESGDAGATNPIMLLTKFMIPPTVPTLPFGAMRPESDLPASAWSPHAPLLETPSLAAAWAER